MQRAMSDDGPEKPRKLYEERRHNITKFYHAGPDGMKQIDGNAIDM
jgi:hypothetical protein